MCGKTLDAHDVYNWFPLLQTLYSRNIGDEEGFRTVQNVQRTAIVPGLYFSLVLLFFSFKGVTNFGSDPV